MDLGIAGRWALVCAASKGLGKGCARALVSEGVHVAITARGADALEATAAELRALNPAVQVRTVAGDITTPEGRAAALAAAPQVDILVNNAGGPPPGDFRDWDRAWISRDRRQHADADRADEGLRGRDGRARLRPRRQHHLGRGEGTDRGAGPVQRRARRAHRFRGRTGAPPPAGGRNVTINNLLPGAFDTERLRKTMQAAGAAQTGRSVEGRGDRGASEGHSGAALRHGRGVRCRCARSCAARKLGYLTGQNLLLDGGAYPGLGKLPRGWQVASAMPRRGPRRFESADYDELVDHPFELGTFWRGRFDAHGVPHEFVVTGAWPGFDGDRLLADARRICETQIGFWHGTRKPEAPFDRYVFMLAAVDDGYGGLEHRASTALIARRRDLPQVGVAAMTEGYVTLLGLVSHEYFHTWNVKRLRPAAFARYDYTRENYTDLLWFFEGFTSYYDDLLLLRAGLIDAPRYLGLLGKTINGVAATPGRKVQSVAQASFDAWVRYYRQDENTPNATVSYYTKGSLVGLALDLTLRSRGQGTLDDVMRWLWRTSSGGPIDESHIAQALEAVGGRSFARELAAWVHGTADLPLSELLGEAGIAQREDKPAFAAALGLRLAEGASGITVKHVLSDSPAQRAGVSAGDELLAVDGWRVRRLDEAQQWIVPGRRFDLLVARDQKLHTLSVKPDSGARPTTTLSPAAAPSKAAAALRRSWIGH
jgi:predicted metalloprotease with PDZ domain/NAD(P)-dependent dehydrogenase (short-subunit alcohol dehydrogenase family)